MREREREREYTDVRDKRQVLAKDKVREWIRAAEHTWGHDGAQVYVLGLQEAVELDAKNLMSDAGSLMSSSASLAAASYTDAKGRFCRDTAIAEREWGCREREGL